jgi:iron-sulfur cluster repair protein YtfE (RIC family)
MTSIIDTLRHPPHMNTSANASAWTVDATRTVNDVVLRYPQTLPVFGRFGLDTCCRGGLSLEVAAGHARVALPDLLDALAAVGDIPVNPRVRA